MKAGSNELEVEVRTTVAGRGPGAPPAASVSDRGPASGLLGPVHLVAR